MSKEMNLKEALKELDKVEVDDSLISEIETLYGIELSDEIKKIISLNKEGGFYNDMELLQGLSCEDILNASDDSSVDFSELDLLPLFDIGDNNFIVYNLKKKCWSKYNVRDEAPFDEVADLLEYLKAS